MAQQRSCRPVDLWPGGAEEWGLEERQSHGLQSSSSAGLCGGAWRAALAVLLINHGTEKPSIS
jgi:hypothetical protein